MHKIFLEFSSSAPKLQHRLDFFSIICCRQLFCFILHKQKAVQKYICNQNYVHCTPYKYTCYIPYICRQPTWARWRSRPTFGPKTKKKTKKKNWVRNQICICNVTPDDDHDGNDDEHDDDVAHWGHTQDTRNSCWQQLTNPTQPSQPSHPSQPSKPSEPSTTQLFLSPLISALRASPLLCK